MLRITSQQGRDIIKNVRGVIFDLAGTLIDNGCQAPVHAMTSAFAKHGLLVSDDIIRADMGLPKRSHIKAILAKPDILKQWKCINNNEPWAIDIDRIYTSTNQELKHIVCNYSEPTPYAAELLHYLQSNGIRIGITTGYSRDIINSLSESINKAGIIYNNLVCADEVKNPRPKAGMIDKILDDWKIYNFGRHQFIKIGDTVADIQEAHAAQIISCQVINTCSDLGGIRSHGKLKLNRKFINSKKNYIMKKFAANGAEFYCNNLKDVYTVQIKL
jgi:phosphonoacetaldehyde hydrolase